MERESIKRPAGFRTHILVCVGSTLSMLLGIYISNIPGNFGIDATRIGAQVISGIGFLGAGTIIKEGSSVRGLTTAASLWAIACVGLAIGAGFYFGGIIAALFIFIVLLLLSNIERKFSRKKHLNIRIVTYDIPGQLGKIGHVTGSLDLSIISIEFKDLKPNKKIINIFLKTNKNIDNMEIINKLSEIENIIEVTQK
ncbi:MgtC/SapB family protein [Clostridium sp. D2Q-14]|nr:MgtC/SapB family protein [Anaeromonas gelatinilytica]